MIPADPGRRMDLRRAGATIDVQAFERAEARERGHDAGPIRVQGPRGAGAAFLPAQPSLWITGGMQHLPTGIGAARMDY
jgi:hypothetical protein